MELLAKTLAPIIYVMERTLLFFESITGSMGTSILLVSFTFALFLLPLRKIAESKEKAIAQKMQKTAKEVVLAKRTLKGEKLFNETERIYKQYNYHPIHSIGIGLGFFITLPILLAALVLFSNSPLIDNKPFLFVMDLSRPDNLLGPINILPILMSGITILDARIRYADDRSAQNRFYIVAAILFFLVYNLSSGLVLYWTASNMFSLGLGLIAARRVSQH